MLKRWKRFFAMAFFFLSLGASPLDVIPKPPTTGLWTGCELGSWIICSTTWHDDKKNADQTLIQREVLIGSNTDGREWMHMEKGDSANGLWTDSGGMSGSASWFDQENMKAAALPDENLTIGDRSILCHVFQYEGAPDVGTVSGKRWINAQNALELKQSQTTIFAGRNHSVSTSEMITVSIQSQKFHDRDIQVYTQRTTGITNGKVQSTTESQISPDLPGQRLAARSWRGGDTTGQLVREWKLLDCGKNPEFVGNYQAKHPSIEEQRKREENQRVQRMQKFYDNVLAEVASPNSTTRQNAAMVLGELTNSPPEINARIATALSALFADSEPEVRRHAAMSAAVLKITDVATIVALAKNDPQGIQSYVSALGTLGDPVGEATILSAAGDEHSSTRSTVAHSLGEFRDETSNAALIKFLDDPDSGVRASALVSLAKIGNPRDLRRVASFERKQSKCGLCGRRHRDRAR